MLVLNVTGAHLVESSATVVGSHAMEWNPRPGKRSDVPIVVRHGIF